MPDRAGELVSVDAGFVVGADGLTSRVAESVAAPYVERTSRVAPESGIFETIVDPGDPSREVPAGEPGELCVRGPQVFRGYWRQSKESQCRALKP